MAVKEYYVALFVSKFNEKPMEWNQWKQPIPTGLEKIFGDDAKCNLLFQQLIYMACNKDGFFTDSRGKTTPIQRGEVVFGRNTFAKRLGIGSPRLWEEKLRKLEKTYKLIDKQAGPNFTLVKIKNYDEVVKIDNQNDKHMTSKGQASDTSKSVYSVKNEKEINTGRVIFQKPSLEDVRDYCKFRCNSVDADKFINHYESNGWMVGKNKMKDWQAAVRTWEKNTVGYQQPEKKERFKYTNPLPGQDAYIAP